jgi:hypothetical protein
MRRFHLIAFAAFTYCLPSNAADDPPSSFAQAVRAAVTANRLAHSDNVDERLGRASFREVAGDGGVLVGIEVGLAKRLNDEYPYSVRPIYREGDREWTGGTAGNLTARPVARMVRVVAKPGFAVGGMWIRSDSAIHRIRVCFMRIADAHLDWTDNYVSDWIGDSDGGREVYIGAEGRPVVGLFAVADRNQARNIGLIYAKVQLPSDKKEERIGPTDNEPQPSETATAGKSKLEQEAEKPQGTGNGKIWLILLVVVVVIGVASVTLFLIFFGGKEKARPEDPDERAERPRRPRPEPSESQPLAERPALAARLQPYLPATPAAEAPGQQAGEPPPYFLVRATYRAKSERMARIYVLPAELLVIDAGAGSDMNQAAGITAAVLTGGGLVGALVGSAVGAIVAEGQKTSGEVLQLRLDRLSLPALLEWATQPGNFRARFEDLTGVSIDPPTRSSWRPNSRGVGTFRFHHLKRGEFTFEFLSPVELRGAVELLRRAIGNQFHLGTGWDDLTASYLEKL